jgi:nucleoid DNA-binding protein
MSRDPSKLATTLVRHLALIHAAGDEHRLNYTLEEMDQELLSAIRVQLEHLAEAVASVQRRKNMAGANGKTGS